MDCIFCKIVSGEIPAEKIYEDDAVLAFMDIGPVRKGHLLVIPKKHYHMMVDTPDDVVANVMVRAKALMKTVQDAMKADYVVLAVVGTEVPHYHVHVVPRYHDDGLTEFWPRTTYEEGELSKVAEQLRSAL